jgi:hypothetical protein
LLPDYVGTEYKPIPAFSVFIKEKTILLSAAQLVGSHVLARQPTSIIEDHKIVIKFRPH